MATYGYAFRVLTTEGGINAWLARAVAVLFVGAVAYGSRLVCSLKKQRRTAGGAVLAGTFVAFNLLMYVCTLSISEDEQGKLIAADGTSEYWYSRTPDGGWRVFKDPSFSPDRKNYAPTGEELTRMTPKDAKEYHAWNRTQAEMDKKQDKAEAERRFRETHVNERALASTASGVQVLLAVRADGPDAPGDSVSGQIANVLAKNNKNPVSDAFKPAFYAGGLLDDLWNGDQSVVERLRLFEGSSRRLMLAKASFSRADKTDFEAVVSVQGRLTIVMLDKAGRTGPWTFNASGAGTTPSMAMDACAKRLVEAIDIGIVLAR